MADRQRGVQMHRPIIYGSHARLLSDAERELAPAGHTHRWTIFLTSATSPPPQPGESEDIDYITGGADDLSYLLKKVTFRLHETYANPSRVCDKPPFKVAETGWGEFTVQIKLQFVPESGEKPLTLAHPIKLHHWGAPIEITVPPPTTTAPASAVPSATPSPAVDKAATEVKDDDETMQVDEEVKSETTTPMPNTEEDEPTAETQTQSQIIVDGGESATSQPPQTEPMPPAPTGPVSVASKVPVHAWQYDELVFTDPPLAFYDLMNEHPPTSLPPRNRRARDQRDVAARKKPKAGTRLSSVSAVNSRQGTVEPTATAAGGAVPPPAGVPAPGVGVGVGIPGEPGSADVPLEFTQEMAKGEWNRLHDARKKIIEEMDRWRTKLIEEEKELARVKEEMRALG